MIYEHIAYDSCYGGFEQVNTFNFGEEFIEEETFKWVTARKIYLKDKKKKGLEANPPQTAQ